MTINKLTDITLLICAPQNEDVKSDTSAGTPLDYTSDETDKRNISRACTSSDVECFQMEPKKKKVLRKKRRQTVKMVNSSLETVNEETITAKLSPTVCGKDVESILMTAKCDKLSEIDVNITVISIGSSDIETNKNDHPLNLTMEIKKEVDTSACSTRKCIPICLHIPKCRRKTVKVSKFVGVHCFSEHAMPRLNA